MNQIDFKKLIPHAAAIGIFLLVILIYFNPMFKGKELYQGDIAQGLGMSKEIIDYRESTGDEALWTNVMFSGMPAYQISVIYAGNLFNNFHRYISFWLPSATSLVFLYMIGFYFLLIVLRVNPWLAIVGALAFSFSTYLFQIIEAGHNSKAHAVSLMAPVLAGAILIFRKKYLLGGALFALFFTMQLKANHVQISYYLSMIFFFYCLMKFYVAIKDKELMHFFKSVGLMAAGLVVAVLINIGNLFGTYEYAKETIRGSSELTIKGEKPSSGLDRDYITNWSYGISETWNLLVPNFKGGSSSDPIAKDKEAMKQVSPQYRQIMGGMPQYFGEMPFTSGPYYIGAVVIFLFLLALFFYKGPFKWVVLASICLAIPLSWGKNFMGLTDFFIDYVPMYNKFRTVPMIQVIVELMVPLFAFLALDRLIDKNPELLKGNRKKVLISIGIPAGILLLFYMSPTSFNEFFSDNEYSRLQEQLVAAKWPQAQMNELFDNIENARVYLFKADAMRSLLLVLVSGVVILLFVAGKLNKVSVIVSFAALVMFDLWGVNKRYLNDDDFVPKRKIQAPFQATEADRQIMSDPDPYYRVMNLTVSTFQDASTSYFHKSIGGYHAAKLMRYQELIDFHLSKNNMSVLNMLNAKYFITRGQDGGPAAQLNRQALGNAWFVEELKQVENADEEIQALNDFDPAKTAIVDKRFESMINGFDPSAGASSKIELTSYAPNALAYNASVDAEGLAVFSDIYYDDGWNAYIDGKLSPHFRVNYVLRAMRLPAGEHKVEFRFEPAFYSNATLVSFIVSILLILAVLGAMYFEVRKKKPDTSVEN